VAQRFFRTFSAASLACPNNNKKLTPPAFPRAEIHPHRRLALVCLHAESGYDAWLRYQPIEGPALAPVRASLPAVVTALNDADPEAAAPRRADPRLARVGRKNVAAPKRKSRAKAQSLLGTLDELSRAAPQWRLEAPLTEDAYWLKTVVDHDIRYIVVTASNPRGVLYGAFALLRKDLARPARRFAR